MKLLVYSRSDLAGMNIANSLERLFPFKESVFNSMPAKNFGELCLLGVDQHLIDLYLPPEGVEWALFLSKHRSVSGKCCLTAHTSGNPGKSADLGGKPGNVAVANPHLQAAILRELKRAECEMGISIQVTVEATHHGPTELPFPVTFVEIGSDENAWGDKSLGFAVATAVTRGITASPSTKKRALGVGGGHYSEKFTALMLAGEYDIGHIIPKYVMIEDFDTGIFRKCLERTQGGCSCIVADWKGIHSKIKEELRSMSQPGGVELVRV